MKVYQHVNIVTCDKDFHVYLDGILAVKDSQIVYVGQEKSEILEQAEQIPTLISGVRTSRQPADCSDGLSKYDDRSLF